AVGELARNYGPAQDSDFRADDLNKELPVSATVIERARIQAQVLVPLVKALQAELGEARANALVRKTLGALYRGYSVEFAKTKNETNSGTSLSSAFRTPAGDVALEYNAIEQTPDASAIDFRRCRYAEFYKELGEPELGFLLVCTADFAVADGF